MKLKNSQWLLMALILHTISAYSLITHYQIWGLLLWLFVLLTLAVAASKAKSKEKALEGAAK